jgi:hypothetical protein
MSYKFNRNCWVESWDESLLRTLESHPKRDDSLPGLSREEAVPDSPARSSRLSAEDKVRLAMSMYKTFGEELRRDLPLANLLGEMKEKVRCSWRTMAELGISAACARCDETAPEGSCCSRGLENKFDSVLLLINLLLGIQLPLERMRDDSCRFLGPSGCVLEARTLLCIDYLCPEVEKELGIESLMKMQEVAGEEIRTAFLLAERVKRLVNEWVGDGIEVNTGKP